MKKFSVALAIVMLLSCLAVFTVSTGAIVDHPDGRRYEIPYSAGRVFATHLILDSFYVSQNCFRPAGQLTYYVNDPNWIVGMEFVCGWQIQYTSGASRPRGLITDFAIPNSDLRFEYKDEPRFWEASKTVKEIVIEHQVTMFTATKSNLKTIYTP